jgi:LacI family transcriptional regulator
LQSSALRQQGYQESLEKAGINVDPDLIVQGNYTLEVGRECAFKLLRLPEPPTAIFAANDQSALGVYQAAQQLGVRIPDDLSVVGFDNIPEAASAAPGLTTIDQAIGKMGYTATQMLFQLIDGESIENILVKIQTQLIIRDSCCAPHL